MKVLQWLRHRQFKPRQLLLSGENKFKTFKIMAPLRGHAFPYGLPYPGAGLGHLGWPPSMPPSVSPGGGPGHHGMPPPLHHLPPLPNGAHPHNPFAQQHSQQDMKNAPQPEKKEPHVKKPLNAFMIYMKVPQHQSICPRSYYLTISGAAPSCSGRVHLEGVGRNQPDIGPQVNIVEVF